MNKFGAKKLNKFNYVMKIKAPVQLIIDELDQMFVMSKKAVSNLKVFFKQYKIESHLTFTGKGDYSQVSENMQDDMQAKKFHFTKGAMIDELPFHINDKQWLAKYFINHMQKVAPALEFEIDYVKALIETAPAIKQAREDYEGEIVKTLIQNNMTNMPNDIFKKYKQQESRPQHLVCYDEIFRNKILCCTDTLGIDHYRAELNLEANAGLWRKQNMSRAFSEFYYPSEEQPKDSKQYTDWCNLAKEHYNVWLTCREFEYYYQHRNAVYEGGSMTENMNIGSIRYALLSRELVDYNYDRSQLLKNTQQNMGNVI